MDFSSKEYLPCSEERIAHLREIIGGRPVAILADGPSVGELEKRIGELRGADGGYKGDAENTPFPIISYDDTFDYLLTGKGFDRKADWHVPKVSIITLADTGDFLKDTIESVSRQSYSNHEHIIVYSEAGDEIQAMMRQFPQAKWVVEPDRRQAFKKGLSR